MKIFVIGYSDNTSTSYLLKHLIEQGIVINGVIFPKNQLNHSWKRLVMKIKLRGFIPAIKRIAENLVVRKSQISQTLKHIDKVFFVDKINSAEVRDILISNNVDLVILTATPIIKPVIIDIDGLTIINAHTGWLPKFRGLDANLKALRDNQQPGLSIHKVTAKLDAGETYLRENFQINYDKDILKQMDEKELELAGELFVKAVNLKSRNLLKPIATSEQLGKYEPPLTVKEKKRILQEIRKRNLSVH